MRALGCWKSRQEHELPLFSPSLSRFIKSYQLENGMNTAIREDRPPPTWHRYHKTNRERLEQKWRTCNSTQGKYEWPRTNHIYACFSGGLQGKAYLQPLKITRTGTESRTRNWPLRLIEQNARLLILERSKGRRDSHISVPPSLTPFLPAFVASQCCIARTSTFLYCPSNNPPQLHLTCWQII